MTEFSNGGTLGGNIKILTADVPQRGRRISCYLVIGFIHFVCCISILTSSACVVSRLINPVYFGQQTRRRVESGHSSILVCSGCVLIADFPRQSRTHFNIRS